MEFHISRAIREKLDLEDLLFSYTGNVVFANVAASRSLADQLEKLRLSTGGGTGDVVNAGALFAIGLIDELSHAMVKRFREEVDPAVLSDALKFLSTLTPSTSGPATPGPATAGLAAPGPPDAVDQVLLAFTEQFPNTAVLSGAETAGAWLAGTTAGLANREAALEELLLLWLANRNPAFAPFRELFEDTGLRETTAYNELIGALPAYFETRPTLPGVGSLLDALEAPMLASPDSLTGQLEYIRERWVKVLGEDVRRVLLAVDTLREEDIAIWTRFHPAGPERHRHGAPGHGTEGFVGDEFVGYDEAFGEYVVGPDGVRRFSRYDSNYQAPLHEFEAFSQDQAWMPNVVLMAKSTYVWLEQLSKKYGRHIHRLDQIPDDELRTLADRGMTALWLIGLWERSVASKTIKNLRGHSDAVASAYSLKDYSISADLGGTAAYECLRDQAVRFGIRLASDMVPNHMGIDSTWVIEHPDWFISRPESPFPSYTFNGPDLSTDSRAEIKIEDHYFNQTDAAVVFRLRTHTDGQTRFMYHGNDGTTFAWNDTAQLDYSKAEVREEVMQAILHVARLFPIIRFDAAMTLAKRHVQRLWFPLPGVGGSIPSRAEDAISDEQFNELMPVEFWREVVDRVAVEVPGTLLLAEAFWLLEGYFVRTLGMHRVYNSAFMNMLRDEENAKYRSYLKKTIEFDPDIMKRYVNFMSNPDERTAIDQFGSGDKYFGTATMLSTLPGLPMFAHGQVQGFNERYGMEFKQAKMDEQPNEALIARHQREIAPLLHNRGLFAESENFVLYDFWKDHGTVDENVFAYSNRSGQARAVVLYNNSYGATRGTIHISAASMDKGSGELRQRSIVEGLALPNEPGQVIAYRDPVRDLEYLRRASDFHDRGLSFELRGYGYVVLQDWRELQSTAEQPWDQLCDGLNGAGVYNVGEALRQLRLRPVHEALRQMLLIDGVQAFAAGAEGRTAFLDRAVHFFDRLGELAGGEGSTDREGFRAAAAALVDQAAGLTTLAREFSSTWPASVSRILPGNEPGVHAECVWPPVLAFLALRSVPPRMAEDSGLAELFDRMQLRATLAETFASLGIEGVDGWRAAARVRVLLSHGSLSLAGMLGSESFWQDGDVRWLAGVSEANGTAYVNKESFEDLLCWLALPELLVAAGSPTDGGVRRVAEIEGVLGTALSTLRGSGYTLASLLSLQPEAGSPAPVGSPNRKRTRAGKVAASASDPTIAAKSAFTAKATTVTGSAAFPAKGADATKQAAQGSRLKGSAASSSVPAAVPKSKAPAATSTSSAGKAATGKAGTAATGKKAGQLQSPATSAPATSAPAKSVPAKTAPGKAAAAEAAPAQSAGGPSPKAARASSKDKASVGAASPSLGHDHPESAPKLHIPSKPVAKKGTRSHAGKAHAPKRSTVKKPAGTHTSPPSKEL